MKIAIKKRIETKLVAILSRLMSPAFIVRTIDESIFSDMLERHFSDRGERSAILSRIRTELLKDEFAKELVGAGLTGDLLRLRVANEYNGEMVDLLKVGFRSKELRITASLGDMYLEMINSRLKSMPLGRSIKSDEIMSDAFCGKNIEVMKGSIVSNDSSIGDYTYIGYNCLVSNSTIGRYCSVANNVSIGPGEHALDAVSTNSIFMDDAYRALTASPCSIGHDVWIGANSVIRRGVKVGNGAVVGANSFVNEDVPDFAIVAGTPARVIKFRFDGVIQDAIRQSCWWDQDFDQAKETIKKITASVGVSEASLDAAPSVSKAGR
ncbi:MAG: CatB-related O-acetyltransferase [Bosea sp.]|uniref:CatB-related O-acetyltransferase n=1 Tax=unclassified Bosea (in: a-proteobacteria) TaxID=2653178 RepID=UPI001AC19935|nr:MULTISPECIES: CatB-related O-acetyltransferase [unclassified Bosea (in: a-proteobacteria)]MBN9458524.1 CatB-related O-acetyltransferase [Bosea sp. (in: a-proteobacteria)]